MLSTYASGTCRSLPRKYTGPLLTTSHSQRKLPASKPKNSRRMRQRLTSTSFYEFISLETAEKDFVDTEQRSRRLVKISSTPHIPAAWGLGSGPQHR